MAAPVRRRLAVSGMRLTSIGCSGSFAGPDSRASCYLRGGDDADGRTWRILLDLGSGALGPLQKYADRRDVDAVFFSHLHADHCLDLCGYYVLRKYHPGGACRASRSGVRGRGRSGWPTAYDLPGPRHDQRVRLPRVRRSGRARPVPCRAVAVAHPVPAFGFRVTAARPHPGLHRGHRHVHALDEIATGPTCCWPRRRSGTARTTRRAAPDRPRGGRDRGPQRRTPAGADARAAVVPGRRHAERGGRGVPRASSSPPRPARCSSSDRPSRVRRARRRTIVGAGVGPAVALGRRSTLLLVPSSRRCMWPWCDVAGWCP
jgi:hypothetical protein